MTRHQTQNGQTMTRTWKLYKHGYINSPNSAVQERNKHLIKLTNENNNLKPSRPTKTNSDHLKSFHRNIKKGLAIQK